MKSLGSGTDVLLFSQHTHAIQSELATCFTQIPYPCNCLRSRHPALFQGTQSHVLIKSADQWAQVMPSHLLQVVLQNARNATLPTDFFIKQATETLADTLHPFSNGCDPLLDSTSIAQVVRSYRDQLLKQCRALDNCRFEEVNERLRKLGMTGGMWDKQPCKLHAVCAVHGDTALYTLTILYPDFTLIATELSPGCADRYVLYQILVSALDHKILGFANNHGMWNKGRMPPTSIWSVLEKVKHCYHAPVAFRLLKRKTNESIRRRLEVAPCDHAQTPPPTLCLAFDRPLPKPVTAGIPHRLSNVECP